MSKQDCTIVSRAANKRLNILDTSSFCFLYYLLRILKFTEIEVFLYCSMNISNIKLQVTLIFHANLWYVFSL